ncbi:hypothetical protein ZHAS_00010300 [Anopheles sinensis]|uniref:Uncharacterized protein n=1 Tax=Anopheles sinensis TaxID=74873 RepID=A0A084VX11_ANOSI|nr:hypothetical protein ZHAS_00010300 [Anopheles sinensis]
MLPDAWRSETGVCDGRREKVSKKRKSEEIRVGALALGKTSQSGDPCASKWRIESGRPTREGNGNVSRGLPVPVSSDVRSCSSV